MGAAVGGAGSVALKGLAWKGCVAFMIAFEAASRVATLISLLEVYLMSDSSSRPPLEPPR